jgi:glycosyltransferase involved in cell wall biosynthesis
VTSPTRILITADATGGVWQYATDLARTLRPLGYDPVVATLGPAPSAAQRAETADLRMIDTGLPLDWLSVGPEPVIAAGDAMARLAADERVDVVHLNQPSLAARARFSAPVVAVAHGCVGTWWQAANGTAPDPAYAWADALTRAGLHAADAVVAPSASYAATVYRYHGLPDTPIVVHNGRTPVTLIADENAADHVFTAGRLWDRVKNTALLDRVAASLPVPFRAAGKIEAPHGERVDAAHLQLTGQLDAAAMAHELASRPIFVSSATFEPFGLAVLEAAAAGCPLVLSGIDTFRELWTGAALFVDGDDEAAYVAAIERIRADSALRGHLSEAARVRSARYGLEPMAHDMAALYVRLIGAQAVAA